MVNPKDPTTRFSQRAEHYRRFRPGYPPALCERLAHRVGLKPGDRIADVGAGTGILSSDLLNFGAKVIAVEPNEDMRMVAEHDLGTRDGFFSMAGCAEATSLPAGTIQGVVAAQAFHWFDPQETRQECLRIGDEHVWAAIIWNTRKLVGSDFLVAYEAFCQTHGTDYAQVAARYVDLEALAIFFEGDWTREVLDASQALDREGLHGRLLSCSYIPGPDAPHYAQMLKAINTLFDEHQVGGRVELHYTTELFCGPLRAPERTSMT